MRKKNRPSRDAMLLRFPKEPGPTWHETRGKTAGDSEMMDTPRKAANKWHDNTLYTRLTRFDNLGDLHATVDDCSGHGEAEVVMLLKPPSPATLEGEIKVLKEEWAANRQWIKETDALIPKLHKEKKEKIEANRVRREKIANLEARLEEALG